MAYHCMNNGGGDGGVGKPFYPTTTLPGKDIFGPDNLDGRGKWHAEGSFTQALLEAEIPPPPDACKQTWQIIPDSLTVLSLTQDVQVNSCSADPSCTVPDQPPDDRWISNCTWQSGSNDFNCTTVIHCKDILDADQKLLCLTQTY